MPALVEADDDGLYVVKLLGAGHGRKALVAELLAGEIARHLDLPVPDLVLVELAAALAKAEPDQEIQELLERSAGTNFGLDFLPGALPFARRRASPGSGPRRQCRVAGRLHHQRGPHAAEPQPHRLAPPPAPHRPRVRALRPPQLAGPRRARPAAVRPDQGPRLLPFAGSIADADARLAPRLDREVLEAMAASIPDDWLRAEAGLPDPDAHRRAYVDYLVTRLEARQAFVEEADRGRAA